MKNSKIYSIFKKLSFDENFNNTWPISLIEHTKKLYTKILTNRLSSILTKFPILNPHNYVALLDNSTNTPIYILNNFIKLFTITSTSTSTSSKSFNLNSNTNKDTYTKTHTKPIFILEVITIYNSNSKTLSSTNILQGTLLTKVIIDQYYLNLTF